MGKISQRYSTDTTNSVLYRHHLFIRAALWSIPNTCPQSRCELHSVGVVVVKFNLYNDPWSSGDKPWRHNLNLTTVIPSNLWWMTALPTLVVCMGWEIVLEIKAYYKYLVIYSGRAKVYFITLSTVFLHRMYSSLTCQPVFLCLCDRA
jgi:hypothetical protein